jgi:hypothetical protein
MFIKPYFQSKNTYNIKLEAPAKLDKLEVLLSTPEVPRKFTEPAKPAIKYS